MALLNEHFLLVRLLVLLEKKVKKIIECQI